MKTWKIALLVAGLSGAALAALSPRFQFRLGGGLINLGMKLQDRLEAFDLTHTHDLTPEQVWAEFSSNNQISSTVRSALPRVVEHPLVGLSVCMDARIDTSELVGDTRRYYYIVRTAGSILEPPEQEMLELAVKNGVKVLVLTRHTDCAAEKAATKPEMREAFPELVSAVERREQRLAEFLARPLIKAKIERHELLVKQLIIDTDNDHLLTPEQHASLHQDLHLANGAHAHGANDTHGAPQGQEASSAH